MGADFLSIDRNKALALARRGSATRVEAVTMRTAAIASTMAPGGMRDRIRPIFKGTKANPLGIVMVDHPAASFVLQGTAPHDIYPRKAKALRFVIGGKVVFTQHVSHPGTKPNNFLWKALLAAREI